MQQRDAFLQELRLRSLSTQTILTWLHGLDTFLVWLAQSGLSDIRRVTRGQIRDYQHWLGCQVYAASTVHIKIFALRRFLKMLTEVGILTENPSEVLTPPKLGIRLPRTIFTRKQARRILALPCLQKKKGLRDKAILEMFYSTGMRCAELAQAAMDDVDLDLGLVRVRCAKGARERFVPVGARACAALRRYLSEARNFWCQNGMGRQALWLGAIRPHRPITKQTVAVMVKGYICSARIEVASRTHVWRHTCATHLVAAGASIVHVQRLLGHRSLVTTQQYTHVASVELKAMHTQHHPRAVVSNTAASAAGITEPR